MRDRAWRRYKEDLVTRKRLLKKVNRLYRFKDMNNVRFQHTSLANHIGTHNHYMFKTHTTKTCDTRYKTKYSPNSTSTYYRDNNRIGTRERNKVLFLILLKEYGIK